MGKGMEAVNNAVVTEIEKAIGGDKLKKAVFSKPRDKALLKTSAEFFYKNGEKHVKLQSFLKDGKAIQKILTLSDFLSGFVSQAQESYRQISLVGKNKTLEILISEKGKLHFSGSLDGAEAVSLSSAQDKEKNYILTPENGKEFLTLLGIVGKNGQVHDKKQAKYRQINKFLEHIETVKELFKDKDELCICDLCCGKSYLTFAVYWYFTELLGKKVEMYGVDLKRDVIEYCSEVARTLSFDGLHFECGDVSRFTPPTAPDLVISLHACDVATDYVLAGAVKTGARVILSTPCCQHEINSQLKCDMLSAITEHSLLRQKLAVAATDALRAKMLEIYGYKVTVCELIDPEETPKNVLIRAIKNERAQRSRGDKLSEEYMKLCGFLGVNPTLLKLLGMPETKHENIENIRRVKSDEDAPVFNALKNSDLVCADCVLKEENDLSVFACAAYPFGKPGKVLDGNDCPKHMTLNQAKEKYGDKLK